MDYRNHNFRVRVLSELVRMKPFCGAQSEQDRFDLGTLELLVLVFRRIGAFARDSVVLGEKYFRIDKQQPELLLRLGLGFR